MKKGLLLMLAASVLAIIVITTFKLTNNKENEAQTVEALMKLDLASGVDVEIKI